MGQVLHRGRLQGCEPVGVAVLLGRRLVSTMSWRRLGGFRKVTDRDLVRRSWVDGSEERIFLLMNENLDNNSNKKQLLSR